MKPRHFIVYISGIDLPFLSTMVLLALLFLHLLNASLIAFNQRTCFHLFVLFCFYKTKWEYLLWLIVYISIFEYSTFAITLRWCVRGHSSCWRVKDIDCWNCLPFVPQNNSPLVSCSLSSEADLYVRHYERAPMLSGFSSNSVNSKCYKEIKGEKNNYWVILRYMIAWLFLFCSPQIGCILFLKVTVLLKLAPSVWLCQI